MFYFAKVTFESDKLSKVDRSHRKVLFRKSLSKVTFLYVCAHFQNVKLSKVDFRVSKETVQCERRHTCCS